MKIAYYLNESRKKNLYCRISNGTERITFSLEDTVQLHDWNVNKGEPHIYYLYYFTLAHFKKYLTTKYYELKLQGKENVLNILKEEALRFVKKSGVGGIACEMFNHLHKENHLPPYEKFIEAFEKYTGFKTGEYQVEVIDFKLNFHTKEEEFEVNTYEGKILELQSYILNCSYDEIILMTKSTIWNEIYNDPGVEKKKFIPEVYRQWQIYWRNQKSEIVKNNNFRELQEESWKSFQVFMSCYASMDSILLACNIDKDILYPLAVISMLNIFDPDTCYKEYCESEFSSSHKIWKSIFLEEDENKYYFYIRILEE